ncbi:MAG: TPM domain-containing protein [Eubacteriales bacterium]|nr:TPM domain-containing protein [Eubacteriales bacterium]
MMRLREYNYRECYYKKSSRVNKITAFAAFFVFVMISAVSVLFMDCQVMAAQERPVRDYVIDDAGILNDNEESKLEKMCRKASDNCKTDIVIVTMRQGIDYSVMDNYIRNMLETDYGYNGGGSGCDAVCYAVDMSSRADRIITSGTAKSDISQQRLDKIRETSEKQLTDADYYDAFKKFVDNIERSLNKSFAYKLTWMLPVKLIISAVTAIVVVLCMMYNAKSRMTVGTTTYTKDHQFDIRVRHDDFINTTVITRRIEKSSGSSGRGGGGGNSGSSGGHF